MKAAVLSFICKKPNEWICVEKQPMFLLLTAFGFWMEHPTKHLYHLPLREI
jgi:hypothetical protein